MLSNPELHFKMVSPTPDVSCTLFVHLYHNSISVGAKNEDTARKFGTGLDACILFYYSSLMLVQKVQKW